MITEQLELEFKDILAEVSLLTKKKPKPRTNKMSARDFAILDYKRVLNQEPPKKLIKTNKQYGNKYIPLQVIEQVLSAIYPAHSIVIPFPPVLMEGQVLTVVNLRLLHPVLNEWIEYSGMSCVPLIAAENQDMKWNHANIPAGKGFAIINASKEIGQLFRAEKDDYTDVMRGYFSSKQDNPKLMSDQEKADSEMKKRLMALIPKKKTLESLYKLKNKVDDLDDVEVSKLYIEKENEFILPEVDSLNDKSKN